MSTMSLSEFRKHLFKTFSILQDTGGTIEVSHRRKVYRFNIELTNKRIRTPYKLKKQRVNPLTVTQARCPECKGLFLSGVCMNYDCKLSASIHVH